MRQDDAARGVRTCDRYKSDGVALPRLLGAALALAVFLIFTSMGSSTAHAAGLDGCWTGTIGAMQTMRHSFLRLESTSDSVSVLLQVFDGELKDASGMGVLDGDTLRATLARPDRDVEIALGRRDDTDGWSGRLQDPKIGSLPASFSLAEPMEPVVPFLGTWSGRIEAFSLGFVLHVDDGPCGQLVAKADSPDQGASGLPITGIRARLEDGTPTLEFEIAYLAVTFKGTLDAAAETISGTFTQRGAAVPLSLNRGEAAAGKPKRPQEPEPPFPYVSEDLEIQNEDADLKLGGTLTIPEGEGPHPAVVLITGSGAQNRNEEIAGHKPFLVLADRLTRAGIAVLRTDDRGVGDSEGNTMESTLEDVAGDVRAQLDYLKTRPEIDGQRLGLLGHSEGGWVAPIVETTYPGLAFLVLLAGPAIGGEELLHVQTAAVLRTSGVSEDQVLNVRHFNDAVYTILKEDLSPEETLAKTQERWTQIHEELTDDELTAVYSILGIARDDLETHLRTQLPIVTSPWFRYLLTFDPRPVLRDVDIPVLAVLGEKDLQVPPDPNADTLAGLLRKNERDDVEIIVMDGLNHLMQRAETGLPTEYSQIEETINPRALRTIETWIVDIVKL